MLEPLSKFLAELGDIGPAALATLILIGVNLLLRRTPDVRNQLIPWISVALGMVLFPVYLPLSTEFQNPLGRNIGLGFLVGLGAAVGYSSIVRQAERRWPWLHDLLNDEQKTNIKNENDNK